MVEIETRSDRKPPKGENVVDVILAKLSKILLEKSKEETSQRRNQRERVDDLGSYRTVHPRENIGTRESLVLNK